MTGQAQGMYPGYDMRAYITGHRAHNTFACARITDTLKALAAYAAMHPEADMQISVSGDKLIESNNGLYIVSHGQCTRSSAHAGSFTAMTLAQLTRMIFSGDKISCSNNPLVRLSQTAVGFCLHFSGIFGTGFQGRKNRSEKF